jgi:hypothetical protein
MDRTPKEQFIKKWQAYFKEPELPIIFYYTDREDGAERVKPPSGHPSLIGMPAKVRGGESLIENAKIVNSIATSHPFFILL